MLRCYMITTMFCNLCIWTPVIIFRNLNLLCYKQTTPWWHELNITITKLVIWLTSSWTQLCLCAYLLSYHQPDENVCKIIITIFCCDVLWLFLFVWVLLPLDILHLHLQVFLLYLRHLPDLWFLWFMLLMFRWFDILFSFVYCEAPWM